MFFRTMSPLIVIIGLLVFRTAHSSKPNIIVITADDMGWNDVSFHGSNLFITPNIDALAGHGIVLNDFHTSSLCTPSRSALMTGRFPIFTGMQHSVILEAEPWGLPLDKKILPELLKSAGYDTHLVGKWHLGFFQEEYTPTRRGFDTFYGYWQGHQDYFSHFSEETFGPFIGYDMRQNLTPDWEAQGQYSTDLFTQKAVHLIESHDQKNPIFLYLSQIAPHAGAKNDPLQAPAEEIGKFEHIHDPKKRIYAAMMSKLDQSVGEVVKALKEKNMLENSIILFLSDNGAPTVGIYATTGSNYPLRGLKGTEWEGGTRVPAVIWSPLLGLQRGVTNIMMHMVDVLPTLYSAIGLNPTELGDIDGRTMWETLLTGSETSSRTEYPYNIDPAGKENALGAVRVGDWKYFIGNENTVGIYDTWYDDIKLELFTCDADYDPDIVLNSPTGLALAAVQLEPNNEINKNNYNPILTSKHILKLRSQIELKCNAKQNQSLCSPELSPCLINLKKDPCERYNFADIYPEQVEIMRSTFEKYRQKVVQPLNTPRDTKADPSLYGGVWVNWYDYGRKLSLRQRISQFVKSIHIRIVEVVKQIRYG